MKTRTVKAGFAAAILGAVVVVAGIIAFRVSGAEAGLLLSDPQEEILASLGQPSSFVLQYLPRAEAGGSGGGSNTDSATTQDSELILVRCETWFYPEHAAAITFYAGEIASVDMIARDTAAVLYSPIRPGDLDLSTSTAEIRRLVGDAEIQRVDLMPELFLEGDVETYVSDHLIYTLEGGHLVYAQTVGTRD